MKHSNAENKRYPFLHFFLFDEFNSKKRIKINNESYEV